MTNSDNKWVKLSHGQEPHTQQRMVLVRHSKLRITKVVAPNPCTQFKGWKTREVQGKKKHEPKPKPYKPYLIPTEKQKAR